MSGGTLNHQRIAGNFIRTAGNQFEGKPCFPTGSDYIPIPTLGTYILAETDSPLLSLHRRTGAGFKRETLTGLDAVLELPEAGVSIQLAELYRDVG